MKNQPSFESRHYEEARPLTDWENEPTVKALREDLEIARPGHDVQVSKVREWVDLRDVKGKAKPKAGTNRSSVQPKLVRRQNEWRYSALSEPFLNTKKMFDIEPETWEDVKSAEQNELVLNWQFRTKLNRVKFIDEFVRTTVDEGTCIVRPGWRRETGKRLVEQPVWSFFPIQTEQDMQVLQQAVAMMQENPQGFSELPEDVQAAAEYSVEQQVPVFAQQIDVETVEEEYLVRNHPTLEILPFENVYIDPSCEGDISKAGFAVITFETSKAELLKDGRYKNLEFVNWSSNTPLSEPDHSSRSGESTQFKDDLRKRVVAYEYWGYYDVEGKDELTPIVATWIGDTMIRMEENPYPDQGIPLVVVPYMPIRRSLNGEPDAELLSENQAILGAVTRGIIDLMGRSANGQTGVPKGMLDVVNRRRYDRGDDYEYNPSMNPQTGIWQHKYPEIPASALNVLALQNQEAEALSGVKAFSGGLSGESFGKVATGIRGVLDAAAKREMSILRRLASGMEQIGWKLISMNAEFLSDEEVVEVTNERSIIVSRKDLAGKHNLKVDISTAEIEETKAQDLGFMLQTLGNSLPFELTQKILVGIAKLKRMPELARDIEQFQPQPDPVEQKIKELEVAKLEREIAKLEAETAEEYARAELSRAKAKEALSNADLKDLDFVEQETGTKHLRDLDKQGEQARANQELEIVKRVMKPNEKGFRDPEAQDVNQALTIANRSTVLT